MQIKSVRRATATAAVLGAVLVTLSACEASPSGGAKNGLPGPHTRPPRAARAAPVGDPGRLPGVGARWQAQIPDRSGQVVAVYGEDRDSADSTVVLYSREDGGWQPVGSWARPQQGGGWAPSDIKK
ncbi:hypothetical protein ACFV23_28315, partial [Streptomyces sp. NPDC059627]